jgi:hypothetical protein
MHSFTETEGHHHQRARGVATWLLVLGLFFIALHAQALQTVTLAWNANSEANLAGYKLYYGPASRAYTNVVNVGNATTFSLPNLVEGITYYFAVTAYNTSGAESDYSTEVSRGFIRIRSLVNNATPSGFAVTWESQPGRAYRLLSKNTLSQSTWTNLSGNITATAPLTSWIDTTAGAATRPSRFYLVEQVGP